MKWMIASDLHGSALYTRKLMEAMETEQADRLVLLGDLLYHGPRNALPADYDPQAVAAMLNVRKDRILCVQGNCDSEVDQMMLDFDILIPRAWISWNDKVIHVCHGHHMEDLRSVPAGDAILYGHTHIPDWSLQEGILYLNPGSVSIPKASSAHSYMVYEDGLLQWKNLEGQLFHQMRL